MVTETQSADQQPFHPVNAIIGMVRRPVVTIREIAAVNPLGWGVGTYALSVGINALMALIFLAVFYSIVGAGLLLTFSFRESGLDAGAFLVIFAVVVFVVVYVVFILAASILTSIAIGFLYAGIVYGVAYLLGGRGSFTSVASSLFFSAGVPSLVLSPLNLIFFVGGIFQGCRWNLPGVGKFYMERATLHHHHPRDDGPLDEQGCRGGRNSLGHRGTSVDNPDRRLHPFRRAHPNTYCDS